MQNKIKEKVKKTTDLEVKEVNITVKKVASVQEKSRKKKIIYIKKEGKDKNGGFKKFLSRYCGAIIGIIVAIIILAKKLYDVIIGLIIIFVGAFVGNYVQQNKDDVKQN